MLYFPEDLSPFLTVPEALLLPQQEAEAKLPAGIV